ncbi:Uncharacterised protein [Serratia marcescens]|uniref:Uncharacterized protein n=1 Tax=Serratia marcescens TaxID=615 RepID=A0A656VP12_SERMA|nr:hypothetical protein AB868_02942 [Serratia marcescens]CAI2040412.1 Uncharacterised protein [Serratia marcescens]
MLVITDFCITLSLSKGISSTGANVCGFFIFFSTTRTQPQWIHPHQRVRRILIKVQPAAQPYRILRGETPHLGFVVAEQVVVQAAFVVLVLPGVAQRLLVLRALPLRRAGHRLALQLAEGVVLPGPAQVARCIGHFQRRAVQIGVIPVNIRRAAVARLLQRRQRARRVVI